MCLAQLKDLPSKASVVVLITDGANNTGKPSPLVAAEAARAIGVRIHTIGVSAADTTAPDKQFIWRWGGRTPDRLTSGDEAILRRVSERSGGKYFRATDPEALAHILQAIDPIERQEVTDQRNARLPGALPVRARARAGAARGGLLRRYPPPQCLGRELRLAAGRSSSSWRLRCRSRLWARAPRPPAREKRSSRRFGDPAVLARGSTLGRSARLT